MPVPPYSPRSRTMMRELLSSECSILGCAQRLGKYPRERSHFLSFFPSAADALSKIGDKRALEPLTRLKDDDDDYVQRAGKEVIEKIQANNSNTAA